MTKALTLWQPYAAAIACGLKQYETRSWATKYRGPLLIHASMRQLDRAGRELVEKYNILAPARQTGEFVAICDLADCIEMTSEFIAEQSETEQDFGIWTVGRYAWKLENIRPLTDGVKSRGYQGLWNAPYPMQ